MFRKTGTYSKKVSLNNCPTLEKLAFMTCTVSSCCRQGAPFFVKVVKNKINIWCVSGL